MHTFHVCPLPFGRVKLTRGLPPRLALAGYARKARISFALRLNCASGEALKVFRGRSVLTYVTGACNLRNNASRVFSMLYAYVSRMPTSLWARQIDSRATAPSRPCGVCSQSSHLIRPSVELRLRRGFESCTRQERTCVRDWCVQLSKRSIRRDFTRPINQLLEPSCILKFSRWYEGSALKVSFRLYNFSRFARWT